jgi:predicted RNase H-like HicB family nuclease
MEFPVAIHKDADSAYGVSVPDVPGCHAAGETREEALANAKKAIKLHVDSLREAGYNPVFSASEALRTIEELSGFAEYTGASWALVDVTL